MIYCSSKGSRRPIISLKRTHNPQYARSEYHTQLAKMSIDKIFDLTALECVIDIPGGYLHRN